jgi:hydrogenase maturation protease
MSPVLVIGIGNELRRDDGLGPAAVALLRQSLPHELNMQWMTSHQMLPELAEQAQQARGVIVIDAAVDLEPGKIRLQAIDPTPPAEVKKESLPMSMRDGRGPGHGLRAEALPALALQVYGHCPPVWYASIGAADMGIGEGLSEPVQKALPALLEEIRRLIAMIKSRETGAPCTN